MITYETPEFAGEFGRFVGDHVAVFRNHGVFAAEPVTASQAQNMNKIGVVSADGASTLDALEAKLAEKAAAAGASGYSITSATNNNKLSGTAVIYK